MARRGRGVPWEVRARVVSAAERVDVDRNAPGKSCFRAVQFPVKEVAPPADGLAEQEGRGADVEPSEGANGLAAPRPSASVDPPDVDDERERRARYRAEYADPAGAEREYLQRIRAVVTPEVHDVVEAGADEPEGGADHGDVQDVIRILAEALGPEVREDDARDESREDHHGVEANVQPKDHDALKTDVEHDGSLPAALGGAPRAGAMPIIAARRGGGAGTRAGRTRPPEPLAAIPAPHVIPAKAGTYPIVGVLS